MRSFKADKKALPGNPPLNCVGILFSLTYRPIVSRTSFFGEVEAPFPQQLNILWKGLLNCLNARSRGLTFRHRASVYRDRRFATLQRTLFIYLIKKYISFSDICLTVHH